MKPGAGDDPFADDGGDDADPEPDARSDGRSGDGRTDGSQSGGSVQVRTDASASDRPDGSTDDTGSEDAGGIPYVYRRDTVKEGRDQIPIFLREHVQEGERDLQRELEEDLGEDVSKTDLREAAMIVAQRNPGLVADVLREWGYDYD